jgi:hypothetical protein
VQQLLASWPSPGSQAPGPEYQRRGRRRLRAFIRHARIPDQRAAEFWHRIDQAIHEFDRLPRSGETVYGFAVGLYPMLGYPTPPSRPGEQD